MILIDTSYLIASCIRADSLHSTATALARTLAGPFVCTEYVLVEFVNALSVPALRPRAHALLGLLQKNPVVEVIGASDDLFRRGLAMHSARPDKRWSLTDCISFTVMEERGIREALTYDEHFEQAGFVALMRRHASRKD